jgi:hypothetical protein
VDAAQQLIDELDLLPVAGGGPDVGCAAGHRVEQRLRAIHCRLRAADHDEQVAGAGTGRAPGDRRVDQVDLLLSQPLGPPLDGGGTDGGHHDDRRAGCERACGRVVAEEHTLDLVGRGDHDDEHVRPTGRVTDRRRRLHPVGGQRLGAGRVDVVGTDVEPRARHASRHGEAHRAEADPSHSCRRTVLGHCAVLPLKRSIT